MIPLRFPFAADRPHSGRQVLRLGLSGDDVLAPGVKRQGAHNAHAGLVGSLGGASQFLWKETYIEIDGAEAHELLGDVCCFDFDKGYVDRWIRKSSQHNTLLVTERCDQLCLMCSQPPKKSHDDLFAEFEAACLLADRGKVIGLSGGEPTLYKQQLLDLLTRMKVERPDLHFHVLTNGQHFDAEDAGILAELRDTVLWGIPLYARTPSLHDDLVGKPGAFERLMRSFAVLARSGASIELRTVVMRENAADLPDLALLVSTRLPFIRHWAIMQLENIGFARNRWNELFFDHSANFGPIAAAASETLTKGIDTILFNFPLCTVPNAWRPYCAPTISDWKRRFADTCLDCSLQEQCGGLFEWHPDDRSYQRIGDLEWVSGAF